MGIKSVNKQARTGGGLEMFFAQGVLFHPPSIIGKRGVQQIYIFYIWPHSPCADSEDLKYSFLLEARVMAAFMREKCLQRA